MPVRRDAATAAALIAASLALVGTGLGASFTDAVSGAQQISTGTLCAEISSVDENGAPDGSVSEDGKAVTFELTDQGSSFEELHTLTIGNCGSLPLEVTSMDVQPSGANDLPLADLVEANVNGFVLSVADAQVTAWACLGCALEPGEELSFAFEFSASDLPSDAQGQSISPTLSFDVGERAAGAARAAFDGPAGPRPADR